ncbi:hypothetical protein L208DRAFT_1348555, partial [Tricholoma matsutake]
IPEMNPYPTHQSILVLDNCRIHHNINLVDLVNATGCLLLYLPTYSLDLNPIEESFSTCMSTHYFSAHVLTQFCPSNDNHELALMEACGCVTAEMAWGWFCHAEYIWNDD